MLGTIRTRIDLTEPVDRQTLEQAVRMASDRFPYFAVKLARKGSEYIFEPNDRPFITDGVGKFPFIKTVLYYYLNAMHPDEAFDTQTIALAGREVPEAEMEDDPYLPEPLPETPSTYICSCCSISRS